MDLTGSTLGKEVEYTSKYDPKLLFPILRQSNRDELDLRGSLPFHGVDIWNGYELSWIDLKGKPVAAVAEFRFSADSKNLIESKSFKLYLNSFNLSRFSDENEVERILKKDLETAAAGDVNVKLMLSKDFNEGIFSKVEGVCIDGLDISIEQYSLPTAGLLSHRNNFVKENLYSHLFRSLCPVTGQPDWASVSIIYSGNKIDQASLLRYLIAYRDHADFHEQCVEKIFTDILRACKPETLTVFARYTRRGGLDINPFRSNCSEAPQEVRCYRQ